MTFLSNEIMYFFTFLTPTVITFATLPSVLLHRPPPTPSTHVGTCDDLVIPDASLRKSKEWAKQTYRTGIDLGQVKSPGRVFRCVVSFFPVLSIRRSGILFCLFVLIRRAADVMKKQW